MALKRELAIWLDAKLTEIERRHNLDAKNAALLRAMAIKRLTKFKKGKTVRRIFKQGDTGAVASGAPTEYHQ